MKKLLLASSIFFAACSGSDTVADASEKPAEPAAQQATQQTAAQQADAEAPAKPNITSQDLGGGFYMLLGPGGNIGVNTGPDGVYMIDDKFARFGQEIIDVVATLTDKPITYVLNTHHHGDHSGANAEMKAVGAIVVAHDNVRARMGTSFEVRGRQQKARDEALWPTLTFSDEMTLWFNGDEVRAIHTPAGHTDGDAIVHFTVANIVHLGDNYFNGLLPFVDVDSGGTIQGMINAQQIAYDFSDGNTKVIPGHGPLSNKAELGESIKRLQAIHDRVKARKDAGESLEAIIAADPLADMTKLESFINKPAMITATWRSLGGDI